MREIDMKIYRKRNQFNWFSTFPDPTYGFNVDVDVDKVVRLSKEKRESFFAYFMFIVSLGINSVEEMRMRQVKGHVYLYDKANPTFTVMTDSGVYQNAGCQMDFDFRKCYQSIVDAIEKAKEMEIDDNLDRFPVCSSPDAIYATCIPQLDFSSMSHPTPAYNYDSLSVPRVCWGKYHLENDNHYHLMLNITVSHTLVDGVPLAKCFNKIREICSKAEEYLK